MPCNGFMPKRDWVCTDDGPLPCRLLPIRTCFAQPPGWRYAVPAGDANFARSRASHLRMHAEHEHSISMLQQIVDRVTRKEGGFAPVCVCVCAALPILKSTECSTIAARVPAAPRRHRGQLLCRPLVPRGKLSRHYTPCCSMTVRHPHSIGSCWTAWSRRTSSYFCRESTGGASTGSSHPGRPVPRCEVGCICIAGLLG